LEVLLPLMHDNLQVRFLFLPNGEDPDSLIRKEGKSAFEQRISTASSLSDFFLQTVSQQSDMNTMEGRARFAKQALVHIQQLPSGILQSILIEELSKRARVNINELKQQIQSKDQVATTDASLAKTPKSKLSTPIRLAISLLVQFPELVNLIEQPLPKNDLTGHAFLNQLIEIIKKNSKITTGALLEYWRGQKEEGFIAKLAQEAHMVPEAGIKNEFLGAIRQLTSLSLDEEINRLMAKAAHTDLSDTEKLELSSLIAKKKTPELT